MIKDVNKIITNARPLYLELERILNLCENFEKKTGLKIDETLTFDLKKISENSIFDENQEKALLRVCLAGNFSSGKSSFLNELLGEDLLPVALTRTTRGRTRIHYSTNKSFKKDHQGISYQEYCNAVKEGGNFEISMKVPFLKNLIISDVPGFDPPEKEKENGQFDEKISRKEMDNADVLIWLCKMSDGTLTQKSIQFLQNYQKDQSSTKKTVPPLYLVITYCQSIESEEKEERDRVAGLIQRQLEKIGIKPEGTFFFSCKKIMESEGCTKDHQDFILNEQKKLKETIAQMAQNHNSIATRRINIKIKTLEHLFMQSMYEFASQIRLHHDKWLREYLEKSKDNKECSIAIGKDKSGLINAFARNNNILMDQIEHALAKIKFCYLFKNEGTFFDNFYINKNDEWKKRWAEQRAIINEHIQTIPSYYRKYFELPLNIFHEEHIPQKEANFSTFLFGVEVEESYNDDWTGNSGERASLQRKVDECNRKIRKVWKEKIFNQLHAAQLRFINDMDAAFKAKQRETDKFEIVFAELSRLDNLVLT